MAMVERARESLRGKPLSSVPVLRMDERGRRKAAEHVEMGMRRTEEFVQWQSEVDRFFGERG